MPQPRRKPRQARSKDKVERILGAARAILAEQGTPGLNTNHIAKRAGVGVGSVYEYFPNKRAIVAQLIEQLSEEETDAMLARFADVQKLPLHEAVRTLVSAVFDLYRANHAIYRQLRAMTSQPRDVGHRPGEKLVMEQMRRRFEPLVDELGITDLDLTVFTAFHLVESLCERFCAQGVDRFGVHTCVDEITHAVLRYLRL